MSTCRDEPCGETKDGRAWHTHSGRFTLARSATTPLIDLYGQDYLSVDIGAYICHFKTVDQYRSIICLDFADGKPG